MRITSAKSCFWPSICSTPAGGVYRSRGANRRNLIRRSGAARLVSDKPSIPTAMREQVFLSAEWRDLVMLNYEVDPAFLERYVPPGTVLDSFEGKTYVSLVAFQFRHTRLVGSLAIPFHADFDEVNLRFSARRTEGTELRRGVVFIAEIVPKWAVAKIARLAYGENYICCPMKHRIDMAGASKSAEYEWQLKGAWCKIPAHASAA